MSRRKRESGDEVGDGSAIGEHGTFRVGRKDLGSYIHSVDSK